MAKKNEIIVKDVSIKTMTIDDVDYICITDIAKHEMWGEEQQGWKDCDYAESFFKAYLVWL